MTAFLKLCYLQTLPHNNGNICPLSLIHTSPDALTCMSPVLYPAWYLRCILPGIPPPLPTRGPDQGWSSLGLWSWAHCYCPHWSLLLCCLNIVIDQVQLSAVYGHVYRLNVPQSATPRRHVALYLWGLFRKLKRALYESSIRKKPRLLNMHQRWGPLAIPAVSVEDETRP